MGTSIAILLLIAPPLIPQQHWPLMDVAYTTLEPFGIVLIAVAAQASNVREAHRIHRRSRRRSSRTHASSSASHLVPLVHDGLWVPLPVVAAPRWPAAAA